MLFLDAVLCVHENLMGYARVLASHCSCSSGIMGIIVIDSSSVAVSGRVSCSLRVPAHIIVQPIIQRNTATGSNNSLISRLRICFSRVKFLGGRLCGVLVGL